LRMRSSTCLRACSTSSSPLPPLPPPPVCAEQADRARRPGDVSHRSEVAETVVIESWVTVRSSGTRQLPSSPMSQQPSRETNKEVRWAKAKGRILFLLGEVLREGQGSTCAAAAADIDPSSSPRRRARARTHLLRRRHLQQLHPRRQVLFERALRQHPRQLAVGEARRAAAERGVRAAHSTLALSPHPQLQGGLRRHVALQAAVAHEVRRSAFRLRAAAYALQCMYMHPRWLVSVSERWDGLSLQTWRESIRGEMRMAQRWTRAAPGLGFGSTRMNKRTIRVRLCGANRTKTKALGRGSGFGLRLGLGLGQHRLHGVGGGGAVSGWVRAG